jgi:hypothetical protein
MNEELPEFLKKVINKYPKPWQSHQDMGSAVGELRGLDGKTQQLVKLGMCRSFTCAQMQEGGFYR